MEEKATYWALYEYLLDAKIDATEFTFSEFQSCFPKVLHKSGTLRELYAVALQERHQVRRSVEANLKREYPAAKMKMTPTVARLEEAVSILKAQERELARKHERLTSETEDLQERLHAFEAKLREVAERDEQRRPAKRAKRGHDEPGGQLVSALEALNTQLFTSD